jgi:hypothetical protein
MTVALTFGPFIFALLVLGVVALIAFLLRR